MYELVEIKDNEVFTTSKIIAEGTNNKYKSINAIIQKYETLFNDDEKPLTFKMEAVHHSRGVSYEKVYYLTEKQATFCMTLLRNDGVDGIVVEFKKRLVDEFFRMREFIRQKQSGEWQQTRIASKENRLKETDVIKLLVKYAEEQGSTHSDMLYMSYTKLAKSVIGGKRDEMSITDLNNITLIENIILQTIRLDMAMEMHYKDIYRDCKERVEKVAELAYLDDTKRNRPLSDLAKKHIETQKQ